MSATQAAVTSTQVAVRYRRNVGSQSFGMSTDTRPIYRLRCVSQHSDRHIDMSTDTSAESRSICRPTVDLYVGRDVDRHIGRASVDMSTDMSVEMSTDISVEGCANYT